MLKFICVKVDKDPDHAIQFGPSLQPTATQEHLTEVIFYNSGAGPSQAIQQWPYAEELLFEFPLIICVWHHNEDCLQC